MSSVLPPSLPTSAAQTAGAVLSPLTVADKASAAALAQLLPGSTLQGQVQVNTATNQITIATDTAGTLTLQAKGAVAEALTPGADVTLQVVPAPDGQMTLRVLAVDGQAVARPLNLPPPPNLLNALPNVVLPDPTAANAAQAPAPSPPQPAAPGLLATLVRPAVLPPTGPGASTPPAAITVMAENTLAASEAVTPSSSPSPAAAPVSLPPQSGGLPPNLPTGTTVAVLIQEVISPTSPPAAAAISAAPASTASGAAAADTAAAKPAPAAGNGVPPALSGPAPATDSSAPAILTGKVVGTIPGQRVMVETPIGTLSLPPVAALKPDVLVRLQVVSPPMPPPVDEAAAGPQGGGDPVKVLTEAAAAALAQDDPVLQQVMADVPQLDTRLAATLSLFAKAVDRRLGQGGGETAAEEGEAAAIDPKSMAGKASNALRQMAGEAARYVGQDGAWLGFKVPVDTGGLIAPVQFFVRQPPQDDGTVQRDGDEKGSGGLAHNRDQRFLVELHLTRLGRFQMDGLVQRTDKRFDLIVRTQDPLPRDMRNDITDLFITTTEAAGSRGSVIFQAGGRFVGLTKAAGPTKMTI